MKEDNGNYLSWSNDDSGNVSYKKHSESINTITESEGDDNPNPPKNYNDKFENDSLFNNDSELE